MNVQATANALFEMHEEMKTVKRNKSGSINGNSRHVRYLSCKAKLVAAGWSSREASDMTWESLRNIK